MGFTLYSTDLFLPPYSGGGDERWEKEAPVAPVRKWEAEEEGMSLRDEKLKDADLSLGDVQKSQKPWVKHNFGNRPSWMPLIGVMEELGELAHAFLKKAQGIRGTAKEHDLAIKDAVADIVIFLCDFCSSQGIDLEREVIETWAKVKTRDWKKNPKKGKP